jgi:hypothetical protein
VEFLPLCGMRYGAVMVLPFFYFAFWIIILRGRRKHWNPSLKQQCKSSKT